MNKTALIKGPGQDGAYLGGMPINKGYKAHADKDRASFFNFQLVARLCRYFPFVKFDWILHFDDLVCTTNIIENDRKAQPDENFAFGTQSNMVFSLERPKYTVDGHARGTLRKLLGVSRLGEVEWRTETFLKDSLFDTYRRYPSMMAG